MQYNSWEPFSRVHIAKLNNFLPGLSCIFPEIFFHLEGPSLKVAYKILLHLSYLQNLNGWELRLLDCCCNFLNAADYHERGYSLVAWDAASMQIIKVQREDRTSISYPLFPLPICLWCSWMVFSGIWTVIIWTYWSNSIRIWGSFCIYSAF